MVHEQTALGLRRNFDVIAVAGRAGGIGSIQEDQRCGCFTHVWEIKWRNNSSADIGRSLLRVVFIQWPWWTPTSGKGMFDDMDWDMCISSALVARTSSRDHRHMY